MTRTLISLVSLMKILVWQVIYIYNYSTDIDRQIQKILVYGDVLFPLPDSNLMYKDKVLKSLPIGAKIINIIKDRPSIEHTRPDNIITANSSVLVQLVQYSIYIISEIALIRASSPGIQ